MKGVAMAIPQDLKYSSEHEWVRAVPGAAIFGITDFAQDSLGDIVYVSLPKVGAQVRAGDVCGEVESTKSVSDIYAPVSGVVIRVNDQLDGAPETINSDPYGDGWMVEVDTHDDDTFAGLMSADEYSTFIDGGH